MIPILYAETHTPNVKEYLTAIVLLPGKTMGKK